MNASGSVTGKRGVNSVTLGCQRPIEPEQRRRAVCVYARACVRMCVCVCARVRACMHMCACLRDVFERYDNNISPRLIMIIFKIIILYFIHIRHAGDFPSTGTRLVQINSRAGDSVFAIVLGVIRIKKSRWN